MQNKCDDSWQLWSAAKALRLRLTAASYEAAIEAASTGGRWARVLQLHAEMLAPPPTLTQMQMGGGGGGSIPESLSVASAGPVTIGTLASTTGTGAGTSTTGTSTTGTSTSTAGVSGVGIGAVSARGYAERPATLAAVLRACAGLKRAETALEAVALAPSRGVPLVKDRCVCVCVCVMGWMGRMGRVIGQLASPWFINDLTLTLPLKLKSNAYIFTCAHSHILTHSLAFKCFCTHGLFTYS